MHSDDLALPSNRRFGLFFSAVFGLVPVFLYDGTLTLTILSLCGLGLLTFLIAIMKADLLLPFNRIWMRFGLLLGRIINPIVLGGIFFVILTPLAFLIRLCGRDELRLKLDDKRSHWKIRESIGSEPSSFNDQF